MAERPARQGSSPVGVAVSVLFFLIAAGLTASLWLSLVGAPMLILASMILGGVVDGFRQDSVTAVEPDAGASRIAGQRLAVAWLAPVVVALGAILVVAVTGIARRTGADIDDDVFDPALQGAFLFGVPALVLSLPLLAAGVRLMHGRRVATWLRVLGWTMTVIVGGFGLLAVGSLVVDDPKPIVVAVGGAMTIWAVFTMWALWKASVYTEEFPGRR